MYLFEIQQQIGWAGIALACVGAAAVFRRWRMALLVWGAYLPALVFAATYNVGDPHVFFLPSHYCVMLGLGVGVATLLARVKAAVPTPVATVTAAALAIALPAWRAWDTLPAVDRHDDRRPLGWLNAMTRGLDQRTLLIGDVNWQLEKGLDYYSRRLHPELNVVRAGGTLLTLPFLIRDNLADGRECVATPVARDRIRAAYGDLFTFTPDERAGALPLKARVLDAPAGTPYVVALLAPYPDLPFDASELADAVGFLTGGTATLAREPSYTVLAGMVGAHPLVDRRSALPFRERFRLGRFSVDVRMESWLPTDTIRRAGFGQVVVGRRHALTLERGISLVFLSEKGDTPRGEYASGLLAPLARYRVSLTPNPSN